jgi:upstream activation factor subunit UAF30
MIEYNMPKGKQTAKTDTATTKETTELSKVDVAVVADSKKAKAKTTTAKTVKGAQTPKDTAVLTKNEVVETPTETDGLADGADQVLTESFGGFLQKLMALATQMNVLKAEFRQLEKKAVRELKSAQKVNAKRKRKTGNRSPSGFVKPTLISDELAKFLQKPSGTEMARTEVTREINTYIRAHNLQDKTNGRKINPDQQLAALLKIQSGDELTYFNLQRYMSPHFAKAGQTKA